MSQQNQLIMILGKRGSGKSSLLEKKLGQLPRFVLYNTLMEDCYSKFQQIEKFEELCKEITRDTYRISYRGNDGLSMEEDFDYCTRLCFATGNMTFAVDEIDLHSSPISLSQPLEEMISLGRHRNVDFYCASRRPYLIHPLIRSQANRIYSFQQTEPRDLKWCSEVMSPNTLEQLPRLPFFKFIEWNDGDNVTHKDESLTETDEESTIDEKPSLD